MQTTHIVGVDPGIVHTGVVSMLFLPSMREVVVSHAVVQGTDVAATAGQIKLFHAGRPDAIFIEGFRPRSNLQHDKDMLAAVSSMREATRGKVLDNMGIKTVVKTPVLKLLGVWSFSTPTHHQDLRSAARIAVLGMMKDDQLNLLLADVVRDHLDGRTWDVRQQ